MVGSVQQGYGEGTSPSSRAVDRAAPALMRLAHRHRHRFPRQRARDSSGRCPAMPSRYTACSTAPVSSAATASTRTRGTGTAGCCGRSRHRSLAPLSLDCRRGSRCGAHQPRRCIRWGQMGASCSGRSIARVFRRSIQAIVSNIPHSVISVRRLFDCPPGVRSGLSSRVVLGRELIPGPLGYWSGECRRFSSVDFKR